MKVQGLTVYVYKNPLFKNCSLNGISSRYDSLILIGEGVEGPNTVNLDNPPENVVKLVKRRIYAGVEYLHVEPLDGHNAGGDKWYMTVSEVALTTPALKKTMAAGLFSFVKYRSENMNGVIKIWRKVWDHMSMTAH